MQVQSLISIQLLSSSHSGIKVLGQRLARIPVGGQLGLLALAVAGGRVAHSDYELEDVHTSHGSTSWSCIAIGHRFGTGCMLMVECSVAVSSVVECSRWLQVLRWSHLEGRHPTSSTGHPRPLRADCQGDLKAMSSPKFPVITKLLVANGSTNSHAMSLTFNQEGLTKFKLPVVLQEFFNHGGVIFKMYVVGNYVKCVKRRSLPDVPEDELNRLEALCFLQICGASDCLPPTKFVAELAKGLRAPDLQLQSYLGLICGSQEPLPRQLFHQMPAYETVLTDFFLSLPKLKAS
ncbi:inositol-tetrakisphosphate 1-kinase 1-like [Selaginella moellendorffii]|uniref:inositol-tetrakisphosphate 1-kinase 1-like n=1 Tax=Selaginella moellendorffii TaxID=88036 RepID=UPI000D1CF495|nr:inositol-tetrakisphosphate 1-kinase 1-like [Selaginella moellendorffii]|eukprot:XP_024520765.1 inositol-tetrakisphosphate 1-kinase 1-like [Selaginella moellendorffii]